MSQLNPKNSKRSIGERFFLLINSSGFYPITSFWLGAGLMMIGIVYEKLPLTSALVYLTLLGALLVVISAKRQVSSLKKEVELVHLLVNSQHDDLVNRVNQLIAALEAAGIPVPKDPAEDKQARI